MNGDGGGGGADDGDKDARSLARRSLARLLDRSIARPLNLSGR